MTNEAGERLRELESEMQKPDFWEDKEKARSVLKEISALKEKQKAKHKYDKGDAALTLFAGAGGDDAEDWARILFEMYSKFTEKKGWGIKILHEHKAPESGGYKNITFEILGKGAYGDLKNESGVHRLVRISPFSSKKLRHTSFVMLEVVPVFVEEKEIEIPEKDLKMEYSRSSGPGGQNVNKRETAVRIVHLPTGIAVHIDSERSQLQNKERAMKLLKARIYKKMIEEQKEKEESMKISKTASAEWGHQIRSYVFHPYKMVKDHRTGVETSAVESVLEGEIDEFIEAERSL